MSHEAVQHYYGTVLQGSEDLQTDACCSPDALSDAMKRILGDIHPEVLSHYYGCGLIAPEALEGARVLDLGCGAGRDCYALSRLVGENGYVLGVDMTPEQLEIARRHIDYHTEQYGYREPNVAFHHGYLEALDELDLPEQGFDVIVSNCVLNLSPDKPRVLEQAYRLLRPGGELYFADVYADRRVPEALSRDPVIYGECLGGALYWNDFLTYARQAGFTDPRLVEDRPLGINNSDIEAKVGHIGFYSATFRLFRIADLEPACEDYGQAVIYRGTLEGYPNRYALDKHHVMETGRVFPVCGNSYRMLAESRLAPHFDFVGDGTTHYGIFPGCGVAMPFDDPATQATSTQGGCC